MVRQMAFKNSQTLRKSIVTVAVYVICETLECCGVKGGLLLAATKGILNSPTFLGVDSAGHS